MQDIFHKQSDIYFDIISNIINYQERKIEESQEKDQEITGIEEILINHFNYRNNGLKTSSLSSLSSFSNLFKKDKINKEPLISLKPFIKKTPSDYLITTKQLNFSLISEGQNLNDKSHNVNDNNQNDFIVKQDLISNKTLQGNDKVERLERTEKNEEYFKANRRINTGANNNSKLFTDNYNDVNEVNRSNTVHTSDYRNTSDKFNKITSTEQNRSNIANKSNKSISIEKYNILKTSNLGNCFN